MRDPDIKLIIKSRDYPVGAILMTCNQLSARASFGLKRNADDKCVEVGIHLFPPSAEYPNPLSPEGMANLFEQELFDNKIRYSVMKNNQAARGRFVEHALSNPVLIQDRVTEDEIPESIARILAEDFGDQESEFDDPEKIAVPWNERHKE